MAEGQSMDDGDRVTTVLDYACKNGEVGRLVEIIGVSLSETHLVCCIVEVPVAMYACNHTFTRKFFDKPARYNFVCNDV